MCVLDAVYISLPSCAVVSALGPSVTVAKISWKCTVTPPLPPYVEFPLKNLLSSCENLVNPEGIEESNKEMRP